MPIFYTDSSSFNDLKVSGSTVLSASNSIIPLNIYGSGSTLVSVSSSLGEIVNISDSINGNLLSVSSGSDKILNVKSNRDVIVSGSFYSTSSVYFPGLSTQSQNYVVTIDSTSGRLYYTASSNLKSDSTGFITTGSENVTQSITGSLIVCGSLYLTSSTEENKSHVITYDTSSGKMYYAKYDLQRITDNGNSTSNKLISEDSFEARPSYTSNWVAKIMGPGNGTTAEGRISLRENSNGDGFTVTLKPLNLTNDNTITIPDFDGYMVTKVNGTVADATGNVNLDLTTGYITTGSAGQTQAITGSLIISQSLQITGSLSFSASQGNYNNILVIDTGSGEFYYTQLQNLDQNDLVRYNIFTFSNFSNDLSAGFPGRTLSADGAYNPSFAGVSELAPYINYLYVDITNLDDGTVYKKQSFANVSELSAFIIDNNITYCNITFYSYKNPTNHLRVGGSNQLSTLCTYQSDDDGKISSNRELMRSIDMTSAGYSVISSYIENNFITDLQANSSFFDITSEIITQDQIDYLATRPYFGIRFIRFNKFQERKLNRFYCIPLGVVNTAGDGEYNSGKTKLISTSLMEYDFSNNNITMLRTSTTFGYKMGPWHNQMPGSYKGYFAIYVFKENLQNGRSIAIEFLSVDSISIPFNDKAFPISSVDPNSHKYLLKRGNYLNVIDPLSVVHQLDPTWPRINISLNQTALPAIRKKHQNKNISILRLYDNKTCDVFEDCIRQVSSQYYDNGGGGENIWYYYKLNKK